MRQKTARGLLKNPDCTWHGGGERKRREERRGSQEKDQELGKHLLKDVYFKT